MINPWILVIALLVANFLWIAPALGVAGMPLTILLTVALIGLLALTKMGNVFKLARGQALAVLIVPMFIVALYSGWLAGYGFTPGTLGLAPTAAIGVVAPTTAAPTEAVAACKASVSNEIRGAAASLALSGWDLESKTPYTSTVNIGTDCWIYVNGNDATNYAGPTTATSATAHTGLANVGDIVYVYCGGTTYYTEPVEALCIDQTNFAINLKAHTIAAESNIQMSCFDNTGAVACSSADNTSIGDWDITLGADGDDTFYIRVKTNVAVKALNFGGFATKVANDIDDVYVESAGFTEQVVPQFLKTLTISAKTAGSSFNLSSASYDRVATLASPLLLSQWQWRDYMFAIEAGASDPAATNRFDTSDMAIVCILDATYAKGSDGKVYLDVYAHTASEANVGITELFDTRVAGATSCGVIYGI